MTVNWIIVVKVEIEVLVHCISILNESLVKEEREIMLCWINVNWMIVVKSRKSFVYGSFLWNMGVKVCRACAFIVNVTTFFVLDSFMCWCFSGSVSNRNRPILKKRRLHQYIPFNKNT
jgi:hypothetical protein